MTTGEPILLFDQNRARWDPLLIRRGLTALARAEALGGGLGPYALQAAIAACHARSRTPQDTDWSQIAALDATLATLTPSPVVDRNRAVSVAMAFGPAESLTIVDAFAASGTLADYHLLPSVRADFLAKLGRVDEARGARARCIPDSEHSRARLVGTEPDDILPYVGMLCALVPSQDR